MSRIQLALNVDDLQASIEFYSKLFGAQPAKVRPGYANFAIAEPPLKLVLIENAGQGGTLNHLGVEVETKIAEAINPRSYEGGFHSTSMCDVFGAATCTAKLTSLDAKALRNAYGVAAATSPRSGSISKREDRWSWTQP